MKFFKYLTYSLALMLMVVSCDKHEILYPTEPAPDAEFQLHYFEPIKNASDNYIHEVYLNGKLIANAAGGATLLPYNGLPGYAKFYATNSGNNTLQLFRDGEEIYKADINLSKGKQNVIVHDMNSAPVIIDNQYPYQHVSGAGSAATWGTDSLATVMFINLLYEDGVNPYEGKLQYEWKNPRTKEWLPIGEPVGFGEATQRTQILVVKEIFNSQGACRIDYRILDENGDVLQVGNSKGKLSDYSDYWNATIGRSYMHFFRGNRLGGSYGPTCAVSQWTSL